MSVKKNEAGTLLPITVTEGVTVNILPNSDHEYLMTRSEVAYGYGASKYSILQALHNHPDELTEGKHFVRGGNILLPPHLKGAIQPNSILFTKRGIVRLGFFIKSERAKLFRDWAEELVLNRMEQPTQTLLFDMPKKALPARRNHNRLTSERLLSIMADVCRIDDRELRLSLTDKLMNGGQA